MSWHKFIGRGVAVAAVSGGLLVGLIGAGSGSAQYSPTTPTTPTTPPTVKKKNCKKIKNKKKKKKCKKRNRGR